jgi:hypothetical protein
MRSAPKGKTKEKNKPRPQKQNKDLRFKEEREKLNRSSRSKARSQRRGKMLRPALLPFWLLKLISSKSSSTPALTSLEGVANANVASLPCLCAKKAGTRRMS